MWTKTVLHNGIKFKNFCHYVLDILIFLKTAESNFDDGYILKISRNVMYLFKCDCPVFNNLYIIIQLKTEMLSNFSFYITK